MTAIWYYESGWIMESCWCGLLWISIVLRTICTFPSNTSWLWSLHGHITLVQSGNCLLSSLVQWLLSELKANLCTSGMGFLSKQPSRAVTEWSTIRCQLMILFAQLFSIGRWVGWGTIWWQCLPQALIFSGSDAFRGATQWALVPPLSKHRWAVGHQPYLLIWILLERLEFVNV